MNISPLSRTHDLTPQPTPAPQDTAPRRVVLADDGNARIEHLYPDEKDPQGNDVRVLDQVSITTTARSDKIRLRVDKHQQLIASINGKNYKLPLDANNQQHALKISAGDGDDHISIDRRVKLHVHVDGGNGDDRIIAKGHLSIAEGGNGNDYIHLGLGNTVTYGDDGDDIMIAGKGNTVMYGGKGQDKLYAKHPAPGRNLRQVYLNGGAGDDELYAGTGKNVLNGGSGNDKLVG
ncbi:MAG: Hemolysin, chromosomal [Pseudomonas fluorescens]|nr:MAG: Hemolysin, chromosomal [Pseudomonas fluorescens]